MRRETAKRKLSLLLVRALREGQRELEASRNPKSNRALLKKVERSLLRNKR